MRDITCLILFPLFVCCYHYKCHLNTDAGTQNLNEKRASPLFAPRPSLFTSPHPSPATRRSTPPRNFDARYGNHNRTHAHTYKRKHSQTQIYIFPHSYFWRQSYSMDYFGRLSVCYNSLLAKYNRSSKPLLLIL